jgi:hypothetical protein
LVVLSILGLIAQLSPLVIFFILFKSINKIIELRVIFFYVLTSFISNFLLGAFQKNAFEIISVYALVEYSFFSIFFYLCIRNKKFKKLILLIYAVSLGFEIFLFYLPKSNFDFWAPLITAILIVIYSVFFFYEQVNSPETLFIYQSYKFWIVVGCIIYLSGTLFLFLYTSDLKDKQKNILWNINVVFEIIKNIFFSIAFIMAKDNKRNMISEDDYDTNMFEKPF